MINRIKDPFATPTAGKFKLTADVVQRVIKTVDAGLLPGLGRPVPGMMCVEAAVCYALGLPHGDDPKCVDNAIRDIKIALNDSAWSTDKVRADGLRRLAVLQLGTDVDFDNRIFMKKVALMVITTVLPLVLSAVELHDYAKRCKAATNLEEGIAACVAIIAEARARYTDKARFIFRATSEAARHAASAIKAIDTDNTIYAVSYSARAVAAVATSAVLEEGIAAWTASDKILKTYATGIENILIEMKVPAVKYLGLLNNQTC